MEGLDTAANNISTTDGFRLSADSIVSGLSAVTGQSLPVLPESVFVGISKDGLTAGVQKSFGSSEQSSSPSPADYVGGDHIVTENRRDLTFGAGVDSDGAYGFVEGKISQERYDAWGTGEDALRNDLGPSTTRSISGYGTTDGDFGVAVEVGRKDGFLINSFNSESGIGRTEFGASVGFDSAHGLGACAEAGISVPVTDSITGFAEGAACLREDGLSGSVRGGAVFNKDASLPVEVGVMAGNDGRPRAFAGFSFRR